MSLNEDDIREFIRLYQEEFGEILPFDEAKRRAAEIMTIFEMFEEDENEDQSTDPESCYGDSKKQEQAPIGCESLPVAGTIGSNPIREKSKTPSLSVFLIRRTLLKPIEPC